MKQLTQTHTITTEIKKSRFITTCAHVKSPQEALNFISQYADPNATHNCWAYRINELYRFSDDGEPGGSAGKPMLVAIDGQNVNEVVALVTRYFGGIKLGVGGLVRAYGNAVAQCLRDAPKKEIIPQLSFTCSIPFEYTYAVYGLITKYNIQKLDEQFCEKGTILTLQTPESIHQSCINELINATQNNITFITNTKS